MNTIAVGTDGSSTAAAALEKAIDLAELANARLVVISSYHAIGKGEIEHERAQAPEDVQWMIRATTEVDNILERAGELARARNVDVITRAGEGAPADVLCQIADEQQADLLVIGNKGIKRRVLASVPDRVAHRAPCTVMIVKTT